MKIAIRLMSVLLLCVLLVGCNHESVNDEVSSIHSTSSTTSTTNKIVLPDDNWN